MISLSLQVHELLRKGLHKMLVKQDGIDCSRTAEYGDLSHNVDWQSFLWVWRGVRTSSQDLPRLGNVPMDQVWAYAKR
jgi:hypothetical protein